MDAIKQLQSTLSKIYPVEKPVTFINQPSGLFSDARFCWKFFRPDPITVNRLSQAVSSFHGDVRWLLAGARGGQMCISAVITKKPDAEPLSSDQSPSLNPLPMDITQLCNHIELSLNLANAQAKSLHYDYRVPPLNEVDDFWDPGTHIIWVTNNPRGLAKSDTSSTQPKRLQFSLNLEEWRALYSDLFGWVPNRQDNKLDPEALRAYATLAKLSESESEILEPAEVKNLREECISAYKKGQDAETFRALNKLVIASNWAIQLNQGLYFRGP
jgi:hypothetical protein